jgi:hypothetical protein
MSGRFNSTEHIGLYEVGLIFLRELGWVFRPQPTADVGMDALVEEVTDSNPTGRFFMVQVKSGLGNVHATKDGFTYYLSQVHFEYYMLVELPVVFVVYSPEHKCAWWNWLNGTTVTQTPKGWKLHIPQTNSLNEQSGIQLAEVMDRHYSTRHIGATESGTSRTDEELVDDCGRLGEAALHLNGIRDAQREFSDALKLITENILRHSNQGLGSHSREVIQAVGKANTQLLKLAKRVSQSAQPYANVFTRSGSAVESLILRHGHSAELQAQYPSLLAVLAQLRDTMDDGIPKVEGLLRSLEGLPKNFAQLIPGKSRSVLSVDSLINNLRDSRTLVTRLIVRIESRMN